MIANYQPYGNYYDGFEYFCPWVRCRSKAHYPSNTTAEMALSARNQFTGRVTKITRGDVVGQVVVDIGCGNSISSVITTASIDQLRLRVGSQVRVVVKSTSVMIMSSSSNMASNSNNMMPDSNKMMPNSNNMIPNFNNMIPNSNKMMPNSNKMMPNSNNTMPNSNKMMPNSNVKSDKEKSKMTLSARNQLKGKVTKITQGDVVSQILVDTGCKNLVSSVITTASLKDLGIKVGSEVKAVIKSTDVMIMK